MTGGLISPILISTGALVGSGESTVMISIGSVVVSFLVVGRARSDIPVIGFFVTSLGFNFITTATEYFSGCAGFLYSPGHSILLAIIGASRWIPQGSPITIGNNKSTLTIPVLALAPELEFDIALLLLAAVLILSSFCVSITRV